MTVTLRIWQPPGSDFVRLYVDNLPFEGNVWLQSSKGRTVVRIKEGTGPDVVPAEVMEFVAAAVSCDPFQWADLLAEVKSRPRPSPGAKPGSKASSRRGMSTEDRPAIYTEEHARLLDANAFTFPITEEITIIVDDREPAEMVDMLRAINNLKVEIQSLDTGDYVIPGKLIIERKTSRDIAMSLEDKRLFLQTDRMASSELPGILIIEGNIYEQTSLSLQSITGTLSYLTVIQGVHLVPTVSLAATAYMIATLAKHGVQGLGYHPKLRSKGPKNPHDAAAFVLEGVPGVSPEMATLLLKTFGSIVGLAAATLPQLLAVKGLGPKRASSVFDTMRAGPTRV